MTLQRIATAELIEAEISRAELADLDLRAGQEVLIRFRHIRVFSRTGAGRSELVERDELLDTFRD